MKKIVITFLVIIAIFGLFALFIESFKPIEHDVTGIVLHTSQDSDLRGNSVIVVKIKIDGKKDPFMAVWDKGALDMKKGDKVKLFYIQGKFVRHPIITRYEILSEPKKTEE